MFAESGDFYGQGRCLQLIGHVLYDDGDRDGALGHLLKALRLFDEVGDAHDKALVLSALGHIHGDPGVAIRYLETALPTLRIFGDWKGEADALIAAGEARWHLADAAAACDYWQQAREILHCHHETAQAEALTVRIAEAVKSAPGRYHAKLGAPYGC